MPLIALVEFSIVPERLTAARALFDDMLTVTRSHPGAETIDLLISADDPTLWTLYEVWHSVDEELAYRNFRAGAGAMPELADVLAGPPTLRRFRRED